MTPIPDTSDPTALTDLPVPGMMIRARQSGLLLPKFSGFNEFVRWIRRPALWSFGLAIVLHAVWLVISAYILVGDGMGHMGGNGQAAEVDFAVMTETELSASGGAAFSLSAPEVPEMVAAGESSPQPIAAGAMPSEGDVGEVSDLGAITVPGGGGDVGNTSFGSGAGGVGMGGSGSGGASFFGVEAHGTRFAFLVDVSGSMSVGGKIESLRSQLVKSVSGLTDTAQFFIVPFSSEAKPLGDRKDWQEANQNGKRWAKTQIPLLGPGGGTEPTPGFKLIFQIKPRPDAIYFMTDGEFDPNVADEVALLNKTLKIPIHCICFTSRESEELMRRMASQSHGSYTFVPGTGGP